MNLSHVKVVAEEIEGILEDYISGKMPENNFFKEYTESLDRFEEMIEGELYWPLNLIVPTNSNSERAWKESMISMYKQQVLELEENLDSGEESYTENLSTSERKSLCKDAIKRIKNQVQDITIKTWIEDNLVENVFFEFLTADGKSKLGNYRDLYVTPILKESFLLSALSGVFVRPRFTFQQILSAIKDTFGDSQCFWAKCSEIDGAVANVKVDTIFEGSAFDQIDQIAWIERTEGQEVQWGNCYLLLMPFDYKWMLKISNNFQELKIEIHGDEEHLITFTKTLNEYIENA